MCLAGVLGKGEQVLESGGVGWRQSESRRGEATCRAAEGRPQAEHEKLMLTDGQAKATLEFVLLVVEEGSHG